MVLFRSSLLSSSHFSVFSLSIHVTQQALLLLLTPPHPPPGRYAPSLYRENDFGNLFPCRLAWNGNGDANANNVKGKITEGNNFLSSGGWGKIKLFVAHHTSAYFHTYASCVDLTQLLSQPNASWRTLRVPL